MIARPRRVAAHQLGAFAVVLIALLVAVPAQAAKPGDLDRSFGDDGKVVTGFDCPCEAHSVAINSKGLIVAVGGSPDVGGDFALARYFPTGDLDPSFSGDGQVTTDFGGSDTAESVAIDSDGKIVAGGDGFGGLGLARYKRNGSLDGSFGSGGQASAQGFVASAVAIDPRDRIVVAGSDNDRFALLRYRWNGTLDPSFGSGGLVTTEFGPTNRTDHAASVAIRPHGRIVAAGYTHRSNATRLFALARYKPDGRLDRSFSDNGKVRTAVGGISYANSVAIDSGGRIVAAGVGKRRHRHEFALARYKPSGRLDRSFSGNGKVMTRFRRPSAGAKAVAIDSEDRIVAAGAAGFAIEYEFDDNDYALARYRPTGHLDRSFSGNGKVTWGQSNSFGAQTAAIDPRDKIIVADGVGEFVLYRFIGYSGR